MVPTRQEHQRPLFEEVKRLSTLRAAWRTVRSRALSSNHEPTRRAAAAVEVNSERYLARLQRSLGRREFEFAPQRGVPKRRAGKNPRPLVIAPVGNRIVQRAILDVCQTQSSRLHRKLGEIPRLLATPTSVGGLPDKGVFNAARLIRTAIDGGAKWFVRSDIKDFFTRIPRAELGEFLRENIEDSEFVDLFLAALEVELENGTEIAEWLALFPDDETGIPQGSSLSALCANIALRTFDAQMNDRGITTVRYLDDFVILGARQSSTLAAWNGAKSLLTAGGFELHDPRTASGKASQGKIEDGFDFLSLHFDRSTCIPTQAARQKLLSEIDRLIRSVKADINANCSAVRRAEPRFIQALALVDRKIRGWGDAFSCSNQRLGFHQLDDQIQRRLDGLLTWWVRRAATMSSSERSRGFGITLLADTPRNEE
jgi:RNA-directed DNA polymerase